MIKFIKSFFGFNKPATTEVAPAAEVAPHKVETPAAETTPVAEAKPAKKKRNFVKRDEGKVAKPKAEKKPAAMKVLRKPKAKPATK